MKSFIATLCASLLLFVAGCATSGDLLRIEDKLLDLENGDATTADVVEEIEDVIGDIQARTESGINAVKDLGLPGGLSLAAIIALNLYRNSQRKRRGEVVNTPVAPPPSTP